MKAAATFKRVYAQYDASTPTVQDVPAYPVAATKSGSLMSRLTSNIELGSADKPAQLSELQRWQAGEGGKGDVDFPLVWWKVGLSSIDFVTLLISSRLIHRISRSSHVLHVTTLLFLVQVFQLKGCSQLHATSVQTHGAL